MKKLVCIALSFYCMFTLHAQEGKVRRMKLNPERRNKLESATLQVVQAPAGDVFNITDRVKINDVRRIGTEFQLHPMKPWSWDTTVNMWNAQASFEPVVFREYWVLEEGIEATKDFIKHDNATQWGKYQDDFFNGFSFRLYRPTADHTLDLIHETRIRAFDADEDGPQAVKCRPKAGTLYYEKPGPVAQKGDVYVLDHTFTDIPGHVEDWLKDPCLNTFVRRWMQIGNLKFDEGVSWRIDGSTSAPEGGSTASLRMDLSGADKIAGMNWAGVSDFTWRYEGRMNPGKTYKFQVWLKQQGLGSGQVTINMPPFLNEKVTVGADWQKYEFTLPDVTLPEGRVNQCRIGTGERGTVWVDNVLLWQEDVDPFGFMPNYLEYLKPMKPGTLRSMHFNLYQYTLDSMLSEGFTEMLVWDQRNGAGGIKNAHGAGLGAFLEVCKACDADPWINIYFFTDDELQGLMEYLGGPASTKYGNIRAAQGQKEPWTKIFDNIFIELGNEPWGAHFFPMKADMFAASCNYMFSRLKKSRYYDDDIFRFVGGGWSIQNRENGYNHTVMRDAVELDAFGATAGYFGGWDGLIMAGDTAEEFWQQQLLYVPLIEEPYLDGAKAIREQIGRVPGQSKNPVAIATYEYGPGYAVPDPSRPFVLESEMVGKSLALGIATIDRSLLFWDYGFNGPQSFFHFGVDPNWSSHTSDFEMRPHPCWLGVSLINRLCTGDLLETEATAVSTVDYPDMLVQDMDWKGNLREKIQKGRSGIEMVRCFTFRDGKKHTFVLYNRWLEKPRQVTLNVPYTPDPSVTIHQLAHANPRAHNIDEETVKVRKETKKDFKSGYTFTLPPGSAYFMVNEAR